MRLRTTLIVCAATLAVVLLAAPAAEACFPYVVGKALCTDGRNAGGWTVTIERGPSLFCGSQTITTTTDSNGQFSECIFCTGYTTIQIGNDIKSRQVDGFTDFGTFSVRCGCAKCPNIKEEDSGGE